MSNEEANQDGPQGISSHHGHGPGDLDMPAGMNEGGWKAHAYQSEIIRTDNPPYQSSLTVIWAEEKAELHRRIEGLERECVSAAARIDALEHSVLVLQLHLTVKEQNKGTEAAQPLHQTVHQLINAVDELEGLGAKQAEILQDKFTQILQAANLLEVKCQSATN